MKDIPKEVVFILLAVYAILLVIQSYVFLDYATTGHATTGAGNVGLCIGPRVQFDSIVCPNNITAGYLYFCEVIASADDGSSIIYTNNPTSLFSIGRTTGIIVFSPVLNQIGAHTITITATAGASSCEGSSVSNEISIDVTKPICGNAIVELGESCDQGADNGIGWCSAICTIQQINRGGGGGGGRGGGGGGGARQEADQ